jgi:hypothetical protein
MEILDDWKKPIKKREKDYSLIPLYIEIALLAIMVFAVLFQPKPPAFVGMAYMIIAVLFYIFIPFLRSYVDITDDQRVRIGFWNIFNILLVPITLSYFRSDILFPLIHTISLSGYFFMLAYVESKNTPTRSPQAIQIFHLSIGVAVILAFCVFSLLRHQLTKEYGAYLALALAAIQVFSFYLIVVDFRKNDKNCLQYLFYIHRQCFIVVMCSLFVLLN